MYNNMSYEERMIERERKHAEYLARQQQREIKQQEYLERQRQKEIKHQEYLERERQRQIRQQEYLARQRQREATAQSREHFDGGVYAFRKIVLNWNFQQISKPLPEMYHQAQLPQKYKSYNGQVHQAYYNNFLPLILEEARSVLHAGLELIEQQKITPCELRLTQIKPAKKADNPASFDLAGALPDDIDCGVSAIAVLLQDIETNKQILALVDIKDNGQLSGKAILNSEILIEGKTLRGYVLGSLVTHIRMYDVCTRKPTFGFMNEIVQGKLQPMVLLYQRLAFTSDLNESQKIAIESFVFAPSGLQLLQGPPGTGKTTTIIELLKILAVQGLRVMVCAPSNKAVQVIAKRAMESIPDCAIILAGVEAKVDDSLKPIFLNTWTKNITQAINKLIKLLELSKKDKDKIKIVHVNEAERILKHTRHYSIMTSLIDELVIKLDALKIDIAQKQAHLETDELIEELHTYIDELNQLNAPVKNQTGTSLELSLLNGSKIIFATLSVSGRQQLQEMREIDVLIIDEAGQAIEAETLIPFGLNPKKCLLVGDTKQLPATVISQEAQNKNFHWSMLWRLLEECQQPFNMLKVQYRMHPEIRRWPSKRYYNNLIEDHASIHAGSRDIETLKDISFLHPYSFIHLKGVEEKNNYSFVNKKEINFIALTLNYLAKFHEIAIAERVGIITFYKGQTDALNKHFRRQYPGIKIQTVDGFQGGECDFIIVSFVRSNPYGGVGFLNDFRRLNVAVTRARFSLIMVGNAETLEKSHGELQNLVQHSIESKRFFKAEEVEFFFANEEKKLIQIQKPTQKQQKNLKHDLMNTPKQNDIARGHQKQSQPTRPTKMAPRPNNYGPQIRPSTKICSFFNGKPNSCTKGDKCTFEHVTTFHPS